MAEGFGKPQKITPFCRTPSGYAPILIEGVSPPNMMERGRTGEGV